MSLDFSTIAHTALCASPGLLMAWLPGGRLHGVEYDVRNPTRADRHPGNFRINIQTGKWADFATGDAGGDLIALRAYLDGSTQADAAREIERQLGMNGHGQPDAAIAPFLVNWNQLNAQSQSARLPAQPHPLQFDDTETCVMPVPEDAPPAPLPAGRMIWTYLDQHGRLLGYVLRRDLPSNGGKRKKDIHPMTYWSSGWHMKTWPKPRPLYNQPALAARPEVPVLVVEGEKTAEAAARLLPDFAVVTWPGGSSAWAHADWSPLVGRQVWLLPDADSTGAKAMADIAAHAMMRVAAEIYLAELPADLPVAWDLADWTEPVEEVEPWLAALAWRTVKAPSVADDRFTAELRRANGDGSQYRPKAEVEPALAPLPASALGRLEQELLRRVPRRCPLAARVATQAVMAHLTGRQVVSQAGDPTGLYLALVASSVGYVRPYLTAVRELMEQLGRDKSVRQQRLSTPQQVYKLLWRQPSLLYLCSEWGVILQFAKRQPAGNIEQVLTVMSEVWDGKLLTMDADDLKLADPGADGQYTIRAPHLTMLATLSYDQLSTALKLSEMGRGALEQIQYWLLDDAEFDDAPAKDLVTGPFPADLLDELRAIAGAVAGVGNLAGLAGPDQFPVQVVASFAKSIERFYAPLDALPMQPSAQALRSASRLIARRVATSYAFCRQSQAPVIDAPAIQAGVSDEVNRLRRLMARFSALSSEDGKLSGYDKVLDFVTAAKAQGVRASDLVSGCRLYRGLPDAKRDELLKQLLADGAIVEIQPSAKPGARRKALVYVAKPFAQESAE